MFENIKSFYRVIKGLWEWNAIEDEEKASVLKSCAYFFHKCILLFGTIWFLSLLFCFVIPIWSFMGFNLLLFFLSIIFRLIVGVIREEMRYR